VTSIVTTIADWQKVRKAWSASFGFVPTMGNLHAGHVSLLQRAKAENEAVVVSIFVNPTQFNDPADYDSYPRTLEEDVALLHSLDIDYVFLPTAQDLYPDGGAVTVQESIISSVLEGEHRPGHFVGMLTIVLKLLNIIQATRAYFGEKDYQQFLLVKKMVESLFLPVEVLASETVRDARGLALSSRNSRLNVAEKEVATQFAHLLASDASCDTITQVLQAAGCSVDYVTEKWGRRLAAVRIGAVRLLDNVLI
jgi:pantoate--beta-alanine ligase